MDDAEELRKRFKIVCRKCGGENIAINIEESWPGTDVTGGNGGTLQLGCNDCQDNDLYLSI